MAHIPKFMVIKPVNSNTYIIRNESGTDSGQVNCNGDSVFNPFTKIELEPSKNNTNSYHLRFSHTNRYWAKSVNDNSIVAVSKQPEEDTSQPSCTLFAPSIDANGLLRLTHVQTGSTVQTDASTAGLSVGGKDDAFGYVDWGTLVILPERVAFRGNNGKVLSAFTNGNNYLQFSGTNEDGGRFTPQEVSFHPDGHLRFKSEFYSKFWRVDTTNWVFADDSGSSTADTLFWPFKLNDSTIALRNKGNNKYAKRYTTKMLTNCLSANVSDIDATSKLVVQEPVVESEVHDVEYRVEDSRVYDEQPYLASVVTATNESDIETTVTVKFGCEFTASSCFTNNYSLKLGTKTSIITSLPSIVEGKVELSGEEFNGALAWGSTTTGKKETEGTFSIKVPAKSRAKANYVGVQGKCSVPFSYTRKDKRSDDGAYVSSEHNDGIFYGTDYYGFRFDHPVVEPL